MGYRVSDEAAEARRKYHNEWRRKNKERVAKYNAAYWQRRAEKAKQLAKERGEDV